MKNQIFVCADNSGAKLVQCIRVQNQFTFTGVVKAAIPNSLIKKSQIVKCLIIRSKTGLIKFSSSACIILQKNSFKPIANRIKGPICLPKRVEFEPIFSTCRLDRVFYAY